MKKFGSKTSDERENTKFTKVVRNRHKFPNKNTRKYDSNNENTLQLGLRHTERTSRDTDQTRGIRNKTVSASIRNFQSEMTLVAETIARKCGNDEVKAMLFLLDPVRACGGYGIPLSSHTKRMLGILYPCIRQRRTQELYDSVLDEKKIKGIESVKIIRREDMDKYDI